MKLFGRKDVQPAIEAAPPVKARDEAFSPASQALGEARAALRGATDRQRQIRLAITVDGEEAWERELAAVEAELPVLWAAQQLAWDRHQEERDERLAGLARAAAGRHREAVRTIARRLADLALACQAEEAVRRELAEQGVLSHLVPPMLFEPARSVTGLACAASTWMDTARRLGYLGPSEDPAQLADKVAP